MVLSIDERYNLITRNTIEVITESELKNLLEKKEEPVMYIGTSVTGRPHIGYFVWATKVADFMKAGFKAKILLADVHGSLDNCPWNLLDNRYEYYKLVIRGMLKSAGADIEKLEFVKGSSFQLSEKYMFDVLKLSSFTTVHDANKAASDVVKMGDNPKLSGLIYPLLQALDEEYLSVDVQYGGVDQRKILVYARENLPKLGYKPRIEIMTPLIPGLSLGGKMSSSDPNSKIDLIEKKEDIKTKLNKAFCPEKSIEGNGVMAFIKYVVMVHKTDKKETFDIIRPEKFGGNISFSTYEELEKYYLEGKLHPLDLKNALSEEIDKLLNPIREEFIGNEEVITKAYPKN